MIIIITIIIIIIIIIMYIIFHLYIYIYLLFTLYIYIYNDYIPDPSLMLKIAGWGSYDGQGLRNCFGNLNCLI